VIKLDELRRLEEELLEKQQNEQLQQEQEQEQEHIPSPMPISGTDNNSAPVNYDGQYPTPTTRSNTTMDDRVSRVVSEVNKMKRSGKAVNKNQLKKICADINDEYCLSKPALADLQESYKPQLTVPLQIPEGSNATYSYYDTDDNQYASADLI